MIAIQMRAVSWIAAPHRCSTRCTRLCAIAEDRPRRWHPRGRINRLCSGRRFAFATGGAVTVVATVLAVVVAALLVQSTRMRDSCRGYPGNGADTRGQQ